MSAATIKEKAERLAKPSVVQKSAPKAKTVRIVSDGQDVFGLARAVNTIDLLDRLGIEHTETTRGEMGKCPGCGEDGALVGRNGGLKCMHERCAHVGPTENPGFRSPIDIVMASKGLSAPLDAAKWICDAFGIEVPKPKTRANDVGEPPPDPHADAPDVPPGRLADSASSQTANGSQLQSAKPRTLTDIVDQWAAEGPLVRVATGIGPLDRLSHGGMPVPWRVIIVGAPSAGKTAVEVIIADSLARAAESAGMCVGILGVDEEPEDLAVRLMQIAGFSLEESEERDPEVLAMMRERVAGLRVRLYDDEFTIESAAADLAAWAKAEGRLGALFLDSLHAVRSLAGAEAQNPRESVEANVRAMRGAATRLRLLVVASSEANRQSYRDDDAASKTNDLAAGAESRAVEFGAQTQLMLRTPKDHPNVIHVRVAKNRRADRGEFWLRLDRERHSVTECPDPTSDPAAEAARTEEERATVRAEVLRDAEALATLLVRHPDGLGVRELRGTLKAAGLKWGQPRLDAARSALRKGHKGVRLLEEDQGRGKPMVARIERIE